MELKRYKQIAISHENYNILKRMGHVGDTFDDVVTDILKIVLHSTQKKSEKIEP